MSNKKSHRTRDQLLAEMKQAKHKSLVHQLEDAVLALEAAGETSDSIFSMVHMIMRGFIVGGELTPEYVALANEALKIREEESQGIVRIATPNGTL